LDFLYPYRDKLARPDVLIIDNMGMRKLLSTEAQDLCEILKERSHGKSTVFATQLPLDHAALKINITGESYRGVKARKLASKRKDT